MNLRDRGIRVGGKLVGRVGVEPTTKRLRAFHPNIEIIVKSGNSSLSNELNCTPKPSRFRTPLRGLPLGLIGLICVALAIIGATALDLVRHPPTPRADLDCPVHESANPWCMR